MKYSLVCRNCGLKFQDNGFAFSCPAGCSSIISTHYPSLFHPKGQGIWRYANWLPVEGENSYIGKPVLFKSPELSSEVGAEVYIAFHGYFPEIGAELITCTFKEIEAAVSLRYAAEKGADIALASVGNTANAFLTFSHYEDINVYLFVPERVFECVFCYEKSENATLVMVDGSYDDASNLARKFAELKGIEYEGGGRNVARRDALATLAYAFLETYGFLPDVYFQAVGSGTGAIAFYEGSRRLIDSGMADKLPRIVVAQNEPFTPIVDAWQRKSREIGSYEYDPLDVVYAKVLTNKNPLYSMRGGLYDIMGETGGFAVSASEREAKEAGKLFREIYGVDLYPAAAVALAALLKSNVDGKVLLNITGAGFRRLKKDYRIKRPKPDFVITDEDDLETIA
jgi:cysteate synthase